MSHASDNIDDLRKALSIFQQRVAALEQSSAAALTALEHSSTMLAQSIPINAEFLQIINHELRTPLHVIQGLTEVLQESSQDTLSEKQLLWLDAIVENSQHLFTLVSKILDLAALNAGAKLPPQKLSVTIEDICRASLHASRQDAFQHNISVSFSIDAPHTTMQADGESLKQILTYLLQNAIIFTPAGGQAGLYVSGDSEYPIIHFTVWDKGIGIAPQYHERIFQPFVQIESGLSRHYTGLGLGLTLAAQLTALQGGSISVSSDKDQGSSFTVTLPLAQSEPDQPDPTADAPDTGVPLLLIEHHEYLSNSLRQHLQANGYHVSAVQTGIDAIIACRQSIPQIILLDMQTPGLDAIDVLHLLRAEPDIADVPVIVFTSLALPEQRARCLEAGARAYLSKPLELSHLLAVLAQHLP
jgi:signal transduction histidine kinase/CheY-like chemotaxis protein